MTTFAKLKCTQKFSPSQYALDASGKSRKFYAARKAVGSNSRNFHAANISCFTVSHLPLLSHNYMQGLINLEILFCFHSHSHVLLVVTLILRWIPTEKLLPKTSPVHCVDSHTENLFLVTASMHAVKAAGPFTSQS